MKTIPLTKGKVALVDDGDYEQLSKFKWSTDSQGERCYAIREQRGKRIRMHRDILRPPSGMDVDHKNGNGLDNRRENLRLATRSQNILNARRWSHNRSGYKGISRSNGNSGGWRAEIQVDGKRHYLGCFGSKEEAAQAYDRAAKELSPEFHKTNQG